MMWSQLVLCLLVGLVSASTNPAWKESTEYVYLINGRTLSSLHEASDQYSGIFLKAYLTVTLRTDGKLQGRIATAQYAQIHSYLPDGWRSEVPESQLSYKQLPLSNKPFQIIMQDGLIRKLIVEKELANWEVNVIKSIVSQFQWDIQGKTVIYSPMNNLPSNDRFDGVFKTMEETVTGKTETLYEINPLPEYLLQSQTWLPLQKLKEDDQVIEVTKSKNYTNAEERPSYHYGFGQVKEFEPTSNKMGNFFIRESYSRAILTGQFSKFVIQKAFTVNKILVNPTFNNKEMGSVVSMVNVTLTKLSPQSEQPQDLTNPMEIGDLVYTYESPFAQSNEVRDKQRYPQFVEDYSVESFEMSWGDRVRRSAKQILQQQNKDTSNEETPQYQPRPEMRQAPESPLLPYLMGYHGRSIKENRDFDIKQNVQKIISEITEEVQDHQKILRQSTLNKYTILSTLVRLMNEEEIKFVANQLYTESREGPTRLAWKIFLDAVAEAGTGPAFLNVQEWIQSKKIQEYEAAEVVTTMAHAVRVPTEEYMRKFYELVTNPQVNEQEYLNETAILSYTDLVYKVYVNRNVSHNQFPVHSFGNFNTKEGREFVKSTVIPYLSQQLHDAVSKADTRKIHVYIRALGNVGHKKILEAFEPYLEGQKQASQFQRMWMVVALDRLVMYNPVVARSVCYKIYRNTGEIPEVRVIAVYQIIRTNPPVEMLQRMAESTNIEPQEQVVAAIKSVINTASLLTAPEYQFLKQAAESAKPLLTRKVYGGDYSFIDIRDYVIRNMDVEFDHKFFEIGSQDSNWPKTVNLAVRGNINGMYHKFFTVSGMISSISDLMNVLYRQTDQYQQSKFQRSNKQSTESKWSSANIANLLNYQSEEREQLEAVIFAEIEQIQRLWSFDNQTLERLPEVVRKREEILKNGKKFNYARLRQVEEMALSFPTEMGIPFLYTYDMPLLVKFEGNIKAFANPPISSNNKLHKPEQISAEIDVYLTVSTRTQSHLSFVTPFDHQVYTAGFDKNLQAHLPIRANVEVYVKDRQAQIEFEVKENQKDARLIHYSTWPYTSRSDLMSISPVALRSNTHVIKPEVGRYRYFDVIFGKKETGLALRAWGHHPAQSINFYEFAQIMQSEHFGIIWQQLWDKASLRQSEVNIDFIPSQSTVRKIQLQFAQRSQYQKQPDSQQEEEFLSYSQLSSKLQNNEPKTRQMEMLKHVSSGISSAQLSSYDVSLEFEGDKKYQHILGVAMAKSNAGPKSKTVIYYKKNTEQQQQFAFQLKSYVPNTNGLDLTYSLNTEPKAKYEVRLQYGQSENEASLISGNADLLRSEARKQYLTLLEPMYQVCRSQMQQGNFQLPACQNLTIQSNFLDDIKVEVQYEKLNREFVDIIEGIFKGIRLYYYPMTEIKTVQSQGGNKVSLRIQFQPEDFRQVNFTVRANDEETKMFNISINNYAVRTLIVPHPVFHFKSRFIGVIKGWENFRPTCVIDQTAAQTFSNKTYPLSLDNKYTVVMQYIPKEARREGQTAETVQEELKYSYENYVVLVRQLSGQQKELIITFNHPETQGKTVEIYMKPRQQTRRSGSNPFATVLVDSQEINFSDQEIADLYDGFVQIYALPNGEVKLELQDAFYIIFDGQRLKLTATSSKLHDSITGLCGRFSKDQYEDFTVPYKCVVRDPSQFVLSYLVEDGQAPRQQRSGEFNQQCVPKVLPLYADVISDRDAGRQGIQSDQESSGIKMKHRYVEDNGEICFTIRPVPVCNNLASNMISKNVPVHCIQGSKTAYYLKNQIDQGGNPDFSHKTETKKMRMDVPMECN